jgi:hypothetical protein
MTLGGARFSPLNQQVSSTDLRTESAAWKRNIQIFYRSVSHAGILYPLRNLRPQYRDGSTFNLTSGTAYIPSFTVEGIPPNDTQDKDFPSVVFLKPSTVQRFEGIGSPGNLTPLYDQGEGLLSGIPLSSNSPSLPIFQDPLGNSLLLGSLSQRSFVWLIYYGDLDAPDLSISGTLTYSAFVESFRVSTTTAQAYQAYADSNTAGTLPTFLQQAFSSGKALLLGAINPVNGVILEDSFQLLPEPYYPVTYPATGSSIPWPYPTMRMEGGLWDRTLRSTIDNQDLVLGTFPSRFVENRYYNHGISGATTQSFFGDFCQETGLQVVAAPNADYTGNAGDNILTQGTDPLGGPYKGLLHFPYTILQILGADGNDYTTYANIIPMKRYVSFGGALGVPLGQSFSITYGWVNVCEPHLVTTSSPPQIVLNQPIDEEQVVVGTNTITTLPQIVRRAQVYPHFPGQGILSVSRFDGLLTVSPKHFVVPSSSLSGTVYPIQQPTAPTQIVVYTTNDSTTTPSGITVQIYGVLDNGQDNYSSPETVTVSSNSSVDLRTGLASGVAPWLGLFSVSQGTYQYIRKFFVYGGGGSYCCILSMENVNSYYELPVCSFIYDSTGAYVLPTFTDLRRKSLYLQGSFTHNETGSSTTTDGTILVTVTAGENLNKGSIVYIKQEDGLAYQALAQNQDVSNDALEQVKVLGVIYPNAITAGASGTCLCRGTFGFGTSDTMYSTYLGLTPGVIALSKDTKGNPMNEPDLMDWIKDGSKPYTPVVRVIEAFGQVLSKAIRPPNPVGD